MKKVRVKSAFPQEEDGGYKLALSEKHSAHKNLDPTKGDINPTGEIWIADDKVHEVALTIGVKTALNDGRLIEVNEDDEIDIEETPIPADDDKDVVLELLEDDTAESLMKRYKQPQLAQLAKDLEVPDVEDDWKKKEIADELIEWRDKQLQVTN